MRVWIEQKGTEGEAIVLIAALRFRVLVCAKLTKRSRDRGELDCSSVLNIATKD